MRDRLVVQGLLLAVAYVLVARLGLALDAVNGFAALVWPPTGLAMALLLGRISLWPAVLVGAFSANLWVGAPALTAVSIGVGNTLEAIVSVLFLQRFGFRAELERVRDVVLLVAAALVSPLVSAAIGVSSLHLAGVVAATELGSVFGAWWIGDTLGALVVAPLIMVWFRRPPPFERRRRGEALALAGFTAVVTLFVFAGQPGDDSPLRQPFLVFPALIWAAFRFGQRGAVMTTFLISAAAVAATTIRLGPFARAQLHQGLLSQQVFLGAIAVGILLLGALVAERARVQEALREAVAVRDEFLSIAGHELRTPLSALVLDLSGLHRRLDQAESPDLLTARSGRALRQVQRLIQLVNRLLEVSQLRLGGLPLERQEVDLRDPVGEVVERFAEQAAQVGCSLELDAPDPVVGFWDPLRLEQVATNLIANALKYGAGKPIAVGVAARGESAVLTVRDQGIGVAREQVDRIFERFARAAPTHHFGGLGLGLYIARQIVEGHGGTIEVTSEPGKGSSFVVNLPRSVSAG